MPGPMGGRPPRGAKPTVANPGKVFKRIIEKWKREKYEYTEC